uniref:Uncharacterized protein n=1 Tax=Glossina palpalis gambiensis TaxID=67801 RepID=A0A1B0C5I9_9MUSC
IVIKGFYGHQLRTYLPSFVFLQSRRSDSYRYIYLKLYEFCGGSHAQDDHYTEIILYNITSFYMLAVELYLLILTHT